MLCTAGHVNKRHKFPALHHCYQRPSRRRGSFGVSDSYHLLYEPFRVPTTNMGIYYITTYTLQKKNPHVLYLLLYSSETCYSRGGLVVFGSRSFTSTDTRPSVSHLHLEKWCQWNLGRSRQLDSTRVPKIWLTRCPDLCPWKLHVPEISTRKWNLTSISQDYTHSILGRWQYYHL